MRSLILFLVFVLSLMAQYPVPGGGSTASSGGTTTLDFAPSKTTSHALITVTTGNCRNASGVVAALSSGDVVISGTSSTGNLYAYLNNCVLTFGHNMAATVAVSAGSATIATGVSSMPTTGATVPLATFAVAANVVTGYTDNRTFGMQSSIASSVVTTPTFTPNSSDYYYLPTITRPSLTTWAWVNQGSATLTSSNGIETIIAPANAVPHLKIRTTSLPATPYTITARLTGTTPTINYIRMGIGLRESATGKLRTICTSSGLNLAVETWTDAVTYGGAVKQFTFYRAGDLWLKIYNDGTNITWSYSGDGIYFDPVDVAVKANGFTTAADQGFFFIDTNNATLGASVTLLSWLIT